MSGQDLFIRRGQKEAFKLSIDEIVHGSECLSTAQ